MKLNEKIQSLRRARALSQEDLAITLGVSRQAVSKWELGDAVPDTDKVIALAEYFDVTTDWLLRDIEPEPQKSSMPSRTELERGAPMMLRLTTGGVMFGLVLLLYDAWQQSNYRIPTMIGIFLQIGMCALFLGLCASMRGQGSGEAVKWQARFWRINVWLIVPMPILWLGGSSIVARLIPHGLAESLWLNLPEPLWMLGRLTVFSVLPLALYVGVCLFVSLRLRNKSK